MKRVKVALAIVLLLVLASVAHGQNTVTTVPGIVGQYDFFNGRVLVSDGSAAAPSLAFASDPSVGIYKPSSVVLALAFNGEEYYRFAGPTRLVLGSGTALSWGSSAGSNGAVDVFLRRGGPNIIEQQNGTNPQTVRWAETFTDAANYARLELQATGSNYDIFTAAAGTGNHRPIRIYTGGATNLQFGTNGLIRWIVDTSGNFTSASATAGVGYATGAGGVVTQLTSKSTGVTLNTVTGEITMNAAALASQTTVTFTLTNSAIAVGDCVDVWHVRTGTLGAYNALADAASGSAAVSVRNLHTASLSEAIVLKFRLFKCATS